MKLKAGGTIYIKAIKGSNAHRSYADEIFESTVLKVGRLNVYAQRIGYEWRKFKFSIESRKEISRPEYSSEYTFYYSKQEIDQELDYNHKLNYIRDVVKWNNKLLSYEKLVAMYNIINAET